MAPWKGSVEAVEEGLGVKHYEFAVDGQVGDVYDFGGGRDTQRQGQREEFSTHLGETRDKHDK